MTEMTTQSEPPIRRLVWTGLQKLTVLGLGLVLSTGTGLAAISVKMQRNASKERLEIKEEAAGERAAIKEQIRDLEEADRMLAARAQVLEDFGPNAGPRVTSTDLRETMNELLAMQRDTQTAFRANTDVLIEVNARLAEIKAEMAAATRERDMLMSDIERLEGKE